MSLVFSLSLDELAEARAIAALPGRRRASALKLVKVNAVIQALEYGIPADRARRTGQDHASRCTALVRVFDLVCGKALPAILRDH